MAVCGKFPSEGADLLQGDIEFEIQQPQRAWLWYAKIAKPCQAVLQVKERIEYDEKRIIV